MPEQHADGFFPQSLGLQDFADRIFRQNLPTFATESSHVRIEETDPRRDR